MMNKLKLEVSAWTLVLLCVLIGFAAAAGTIKVWNTSDTLTASDLNGNFSHIHNLMVGGHGARLVDADVNASAAISTSKLAAYRYVPVAWGSAYTTALGTACSADPCTTIGFGFSAINRTPSAGHYVVHFSPARTDNKYTAVIKNQTLPAWSVDCYAVAKTASTMSVDCVNSGSALTDAQFDFIVMDDN